MFQKLLTSALFAGFAAGLLAAVLQLAFVQPSLLRSELFESGALVHFGSGSTPVPPMPFALDPVRDALSVLFSALIYCGYAMLLVAGMSLAQGRGARIDARTGLLWGVAGFVAVQFAPAFSLPPELPGNAAADVGARQVWWFATVAATAAGLALIAYGRGWVQWGLAALLILAPHVIGAPEAPDYVGPVPPELAGLFAARALGVGLMVWTVLGALAGWLWSREDTA
ncbi:CbtA family protein [Pseudooceanicola onchidii]|uniref:CbtA family protein n=1 Tax=Pseudooceanicola onchidii TaxID=2562279 RepID=UPI0010AA0982|nr:CbtA family protein [Pseudooceanicola onchidii]